MRVVCGLGNSLLNTQKTKHGGGGSRGGRRGCSLVVSSPGRPGGGGSDGDGVRGGGRRNGSIVRIQTDIALRCKRAPNAMGAHAMHVFILLPYYVCFRLVRGRK